MIATDVDWVRVRVACRPAESAFPSPDVTGEPLSQQQTLCCYTSTYPSQSLHPACGSLPLDLTDLSSCQPVSSSPDPLLYTPPLYVPASSASSTAHPGLSTTLIFPISELNSAPSSASAKSLSHLYFLTATRPPRRTPSNVPLTGEFEGSSNPVWRLQ